MIIWLYFQDNYNVLHVAAMYSREDVIKSLLVKKGVDPFSTGGVSIIKQVFKVIHKLMSIRLFYALLVHISYKPFEIFQEAAEKSRKLIAEAFIVVN